MAVTQRNERAATKLIEDKDIVFTGEIEFTGPLSGVNRSALTEESNAVFVIRAQDWRVFDNMASLLPTAGATDDLGIVEGTHGTSTPTLQTEDLKAEGGNPTLNKARTVYPLPESYIDGQSVTLRFHAGMLTAIADDAATLDVSVFKSDGEGGVSGADLYTGAALSINSLTLADKDFELTSTGLATGDELDILITTSVSDAASVDAVIATVTKTKVLIDIKG